MHEPVVSPPEMLPLLSRGRHRNTRKGACFMEMASVLAGERWTDHPRCTHPLLGNLARLVNDCTSDDHRHELAMLIPSVVGLTSDDPRMDARIALRAATAALPVAPAELQNALAVVGAHRRQRARRAGGAADRHPRAGQQPRALESAPRATGWAHAVRTPGRDDDEGLPAARRAGHGPRRGARDRRGPACPTRTRSCGSC